MYRWILLMVSLAFATLCMGQQIQSVAVRNLAEQDLLDDAPVARQRVVIDQRGTQNQAESVQLGQFDQGSNTRIRQQGNRNYAQIVQAGGNNQVILVQKGEDNSFQLDLSGTSNEIAALQDGNGNVIQQRLSNSRNVRTEFIQQGDGNLIQHQADGLVSKDIKVLQSGSEMEVNIIQTTVASPLR
jgi:hypothetical protein